MDPAAFQAAIDNPDRAVEVAGLNRAAAGAYRATPARGGSLWHGRVRVSMSIQADGSYTIYITAVTAS